MFFFFAGVSIIAIVVTVWAYKRSHNTFKVNKGNFFEDHDLSGFPDIDAELILSAAKRLDGTKMSFHDRNGNITFRIRAVPDDEWVELERLVKGVSRTTTVYSRSQTFLDSVNFYRSASSSSLKINFQMPGIRLKVTKSNSNVASRVMRLHLKFNRKLAFTAFDDFSDELDDFFDSRPTKSSMSRVRSTALLLKDVFVACLRTGLQITGIVESITRILTR